MQTQKVAIITGASSGIGLATAKKLTKEGWRVYGVSRRPSRANFESFSADVNDTQAMCDIFKTVYQREGRIDALINNAGFGIAGAIEETTTENIEAIVKTNLTSLINLSSKILPYLRKSKGRLVNISSVGGIIPLPFQACYSATKAAVETFSRALATEVAPFGVKVTAILPGDTKTGFTKSRVLDEDPTSPYNKAMKSYVEKMAKDEQNGKSPDYVANVIFKVLSKKNPPLRKSIGMVSKFEIFLTRIVPTKFVNFVVRKIYE